MNGYGLYVWFSFSIVVISCAIVYYKTKIINIKFYYNYVNFIKLYSRMFSGGFS